MLKFWRYSISVRWERLRVARSLRIGQGVQVRLLRDDVVIHEGSVHAQRFKEDAREVREGTECGMSFENYQDLKTGDMIECFEVEEIARHL